LTPDGPRGPRRHVQPGIVYLAARTGWPIVPIGVGFQKAWRMRSWDCFAVPRPFSRVRCLVGHPLHLPPHLPRERFPHYAELLRRHLNHLCAQAQLWAKQGVLPWTFPQPSPLKKTLCPADRRIPMTAAASTWC
ncbi:MAG: hypothetical protein NZ703_15025, partial [Gemmataceae bacterium]|nr:hypothetical protein [Gemmataceae bacterium]